MSAIQEGYESFSKKPITSTDELIEILEKGFNKTNKFTTLFSPTGEKHQVIFFPVEPLKGSMIIQEMKLDFLSSGHSFSFTSGRVKIKGYNKCEKFLVRNTTVREKIIQRE